MLKLAGNGTQVGHLFWFVQVSIKHLSLQKIVLYKYLLSIYLVLYEYLLSTYLYKKYLQKHLSLLDEDKTLHTSIESKQQKYMREKEILQI